jgi:hypothetical protein
VAKKRHRTGQPGNVNRLLLNRWATGTSGPDRLWDRNGTLWELAVDGLSQDRTHELYLDPAVPVVVHEGAGALIWIEPDERRQRWVGLEARAFDPSWSPPKGEGGSRSFTAQEWRAGDASLLLFEDYD